MTETGPDEEPIYQASALDEGEPPTDHSDHLDLTRPPDPNGARNAHYQALYVQLPFEIAPVVATYPAVVIPPRAGSEFDGLPPVRLRFHTAADSMRTVDSRALTVAAERAGGSDAERTRAALTSALQRRVDMATRDRVSVAEVEAPIPVDRRGTFDPALSRRLTDHSIAGLNRFLDVYQVLTEQVTVHHLNPDNLGPETILEFRNDSDAPTGNLVAPHHQGRVPSQEDPPAEHLLRLISSALTGEPNRHPLDLVRRLYLRASRYADQGEYEAAIDALQTSAERLVYALHTLVLVDQNVSSADIKSRLPGTFAKAVRALPGLLGGNWSLRGTGAVAVYWANLYLVRNDITHLGITPDRDNVPDAFDAYDGLWRHVLDRVLARRATYPRTALAVHGGIGLKKAGALDNRMRDLITTIESRNEGRSFWLPRDARS